MARSMPINRKTLYNVCPYLFFFKLSLDYASLAFLLSFQMRKKTWGKPDDRKRALFLDLSTTAAL